MTFKNKSLALGVYKSGHVQRKQIQQVIFGKTPTNLEPIQNTSRQGLLKLKIV